MLISELNEFTGTLGASDYFAIDNGNDTRKVSSQAIVNKVLASVREIFYGTSSTSASTSTKVVSCSGFALKTGAVIAVKFSNAQTSTASIYLNVNGTGAKQVYGIPRATTSTSRLDGAWEANEVKLFVYDGSYWRIVDQNIITNDQLTSLNNILNVYGLYNVLNALATKSAKPVAVTVTEDVSITCNANAYGSNTKQITVPDGYTPVGIVKYVASASACVPITINVSKTGLISLGYRNITSSSVTITVTTTVLCVLN